MYQLPGTPPPPRPRTLFPSFPEVAIMQNRGVAGRNRRHRGHAFRRKKHEAAHRLAGPQGPWGMVGLRLSVI